MTWLRLAKSALVVLAIGAAVSTANAAVLYDNGGPDFSSGNEMTTWIQAEDFDLAGPPVFLTDVTFWSLEFGSAYTGEITWTIYGDGAGEPGGILYRGSTTSVTRTLEGGYIGGDLYRNDFSVGSLLLGPGTYWLGLHNGPLTTDARLDMYWATTTANLTVRGHEDITPFDDGDWFNNAQEHAFKLYGEVVPEPSSVISLVLGVGACGGLSWMRRRRSIV